MDTRIEILINGEKRELPAGWTMKELLEDLELNRQRVAVELNREILEREKWDVTEIKDDDAIEIVHFVGGGGNVKYER